MRVYQFRHFGRLDQRLPVNRKCSINRRADNPVACGDWGMVAAEV